MNAQQELYEIAKVRAPLAKRTDGAGEVILAVGSTSVRVQVPTWMQGKYCSFKSSGCISEVLFGSSSSVDVVYGQATGVVSEVMTVHANSGRRISDGETRQWRVPTPGDLGVIPGTTIYMSVESSATGTLHIGLESDNKVGHDKGK